MITVITVNTIRAILAFVVFIIPPQLDTAAQSYAALFHCASLINTVSNIRNRTNTADTNTIKIEAMYTSRIDAPVGSEGGAGCWSGGAGNVAGATIFVVTVSPVENRKKI